MPDEIGTTSTHEHLFADSTSDRLDTDTKLDDPVAAIEELLAFKRAGGDTVVEVTTVDMGRNISQLAKVSAASGVRVVASTGYYKGNYDPIGGQPRRRWSFLPQEFREASVQHLARSFMREVCDGVARTGIRVGIIGEIGTSYRRILDEEEKVFRAAGRANYETGVPISTHTTLGTMGREQIEILKEEGADPAHVVVCHLDLLPDTAYHTELARQGVFLGFDTVGKESYQSDATRAEVIRMIVREGFEDQVILGCDIGRRSQMTAYGGRGCSYLLTDFVPRLEVLS
jgi:phosphotriesterase-related protein